MKRPKLFTISFFVIPEDEYDYINYRQSLESATFFSLQRSYDVKHIKIHDSSYIPTGLNPGEFFFGSKTKLIIQHHAERPFTNKIKLWLQRLAYSEADAYLFASKKLANSF